MVFKFIVCAMMTLGPADLLSQSGGPNNNTGERQADVAPVPEIDSSAIKAEKKEETC
tara:strand:+ start:41 stop:211 length:171 start_codon:yes stop_codon:yes gene_type:complete